MDDLQASDEEVKQSPGFSPIWLLPLAALVTVVWMGWKTLQEEGVLVHVRFDSGQGIKVGKTEVRHNGLAVGKVRAMTMTEDLEGINVEIEMDRRMEPYLTESSRFWLVRPQVTVAGISGLDTLVSGNFIAFRPSEKGSKRKTFIALKSPPSLGEGEAGLTLFLRAEELSSIQLGSPVYYRRLKVGEVSGYNLSDDDRSVDVEVFIKPEFSHLVRRNSRFWNAGGVDVSGSLTNLKVRTQSLVSMVQGGVSFYTPDWEEPEPLAGDGNRFQLHRDYDEAEVGIPVSIEFPLDVALGREKTRVLFHGMEVGLIKEIDFKSDYAGILARAVIRPDFNAILVKGARFWIVEPQIGLKGVSGLETLLGGRYVAMDVSQVDMSRSETARSFKGYTHKPPASPSAPGLHLELRAESLAGITHGSPVLYRKMSVGSVQSHELSGKGVTVKLLIEPRFSHLVNSSSRFWNVSGLTLEGGLQGFKIRADTLNSLLSGGIAFDSPDPAAAGSKNEEVFTLYDDAVSAREKNIKIQLHFATAEGLQRGTLLKYRGLEVGRITQLLLEEGEVGIVAAVHLKEDAAWMARKGSRFWLVRPKLGLTNTANLETLVTGQYINVAPGTESKAETKTRFIVEADIPDDQPLASGLRVELLSKRLGSIRRGNPVYYREVTVGKVTGFRLDSPADRVIIIAHIDERYAPLVTEHSQFWNASGIDVDVGLFSGARIRTESLEALLSGGISFATPSKAPPIASGMRFELADKARKEWLEWTPGIQLEAGN
ncbi:MAG: MlaD family protein [Endozoicomonas sp.]